MQLNDILGKFRHRGLLNGVLFRNLGIRHGKQVEPCIERTISGFPLRRAEQ